MTWHAKPQGPYSYVSSEGNDNITEMISHMSSYTDEAKTAVVTNSIYEGGLNPWRWQSDTYGRSRGYGLFQFTPASSYIDLAGATPNLSVTSITPGATPEDGAYQMDCMVNDTLGKWHGSCWRSYWDQTTNADLYAYRNAVVDRWGSAYAVSQSEFAACTDLDAALFIFFAAYEGPRNPAGYYTRQTLAPTIYQIITGQSPPPTPPIPPTPTPTMPLPIWLYWKMKKNSDKEI